MNRWGYFARRLALSVPVLLLGVTLTFVIVRLGPSDPVAVVLGSQRDPAAAEALERQLGLHKSLWAQYVDFMIGLFTLDFGKSWVIRPDKDVFQLVTIYAPRTMWLGVWSVLIAVFVGIPLGFFAGLRQNSASDYLASFGGIVWRAMPNFWLAIILMTLLTQSDKLFGFEWQTWLTATTVTGPPDLNGLGDPDQFLAAVKKIMPAAVVLGSSSMGNEMRIGRTAVLETINEKYVETARAKGVSRRRLVWKHVFRNALIPLVPIISGEAFLLIGGSVLVETVFGINGLGYLFFQAAFQGDLPMVGSLMFIFITLIVFVNILQDFLYTVIDPRVGYEGGT
jgi:peptide/nickel transport system permease protein